MSESETSIQLPILDISQPLTPSSVSSIAAACRDWGFFHITNHGVSRQLYKQLHSLTTHIFNLPLEEKLRAGPSSQTKAYTPPFIASPFFESLRVSGPDFFASASASSQAILDHRHSELRYTKTWFSLFEILVSSFNSSRCNSCPGSVMVQEYGNRMVQLSETLVEVVLAILGPDFDKKFMSEFRNCHGYLRINNYTPPPDQGAEAAGEEAAIEGLGMHTDMSCITVVYQDEKGGLQVRSKEGNWMEISPCQDTLVVNIGDLMQVGKC